MAECGNDASTEETISQASHKHTTNGHSHGSNGVTDRGTFSKERNMGGEDEKKTVVQDIPLDFSVKRKSVESISESLTDDSQVSSVSPPASHGSQESYPEHKSNETTSNGSSRSSDPNGDPRASLPLSPNSLPMGLVPGMGSGFVPNGHLPNMPGFMDQRLLHGNKNSRPFKAYPKEALSMPLGYYGMAGMPPMPQIDGQALQGLNLSSDEIMNIYQQQLQVLRERDKQLLTMAKQHMRVETTSPTRTGASSSGSSNNGTTMSPPLPNCVSPQPRLPPPSSRPSPMVSSTSALTAAGRKRPRSLPDEQKDSAYWERRRKNNDAAKRSRDARRAKEDEIAIRAALLEQENLKLRVEVAALKTETARLRCMLYNS
ncbi:cyclic AMP-dependent transcription factor ATF-7-like [Haliotis cracherodii]|uniref:cyclic AMP-dependent transcription factor ATF-7-like n=1 Tax=Haliotis cracherodii TaxID=6455 RepID=UPI0039ED02D9